MTANVSAGTTPFPVRGDLAGADLWEMADRAEELAERAALEESERRLEAAILRARRRLEGERRRGASRRRSRR